MFKNPKKYHSGDKLSLFVYMSAFNATIKDGFTPDFVLC